MDFIYSIATDTEEPIMLLDRLIGQSEESGQGIDGAIFQRELFALDAMGKKRIQVWINSEGGKVLDSFNICNAILKSKTKVDTYCFGVAASSAFNVFQMGRKRIMADYAFLMTHNPFKADATDLTPAEAAMVETFRKSLVTLVSSKCGKTEEEVSAMMDKETWFTSSEALTGGYCDEIQVSKDYNKQRMAAAADMQARIDTGKLFLSEVVNQINYKKHVIMKDVTAKLNLTEGASETAHIQAINAIENRATTAETSLEQVRAELTTAQTTLQEKETSLADVTNELNTLKQEKADAEKAAKEKAAKDLVTGAVNLGQIENKVEVVAKWEKLAYEDYDGTKVMVDSLKINKAAPKIVTPTGASGGVKNMAARMAEIRKNTVRK